jgi:2-polyprenyl-3-methyl-5-hydroxy-6-metoxy-1,4-benzoquinol methylase
MTTRIPRLEARCPKVPRWDEAALVERRSPFGGERGVPCYERADGLVVHRCATTGAYYVSPGPTEAALAAFYRTYLREYREDDGFQQEFAIREVSRAEPLDEPRIAIIDGAIDGLDGRRVLDVGFGLAHNMVRLRASGADVEGVDTDPDAVAVARDALGFGSRVSTTDFLGMPEGAGYDLLTMYDIIEHPLDPLAFLRKAHRLLRPGGLLAVDTPNATYVGRSPQSLHVFQVDLEHMQYFTAGSVIRLAQDHRWGVLHLEQYGFPSGAGPVRSLVPSRLDGPRRIASSVRGLGPVQRLLRYRRALGRAQMRRGTYALFAVLRKE